MAVGDLVSALSIHYRYEEEKFCHMEKEILNLQI